VRLFKNTTLDFALIAAAATIKVTPADSSCHPLFIHLRALKMAERKIAQTKQLRDHVFLLRAAPAVASSLKADLIFHVFCMLPTMIDNSLNTYLLKVKSQQLNF
jgi:hypothetical protein